MAYDTAIPIGSGGMGEVFKAWDAELSRWVALKYLRRDEPELVERLMREARAQARVDHPGICKVYQVGEDDGRPFIEMQYVDGQQLDQAAEGMTLEQKVLVVKQVAEAVQAAHSEGLIHRDLKPGNIMISEGEHGELRPYVLDFGIAREQTVAGLTATGQVLGTPGYLSPEQARGEVGSLDRRTDIFSLGVILYELLCGEGPFAGDSSIEVLVSLLEDEPAPLSDKLEKVPRDLETVVMRCLEKNAEGRYPSARALADDLGRFLDGEPVEARPVGRLERIVRRARKNPLTTAALVAAAVALVTLAVVAVGGWAKYTVDLKRERDLAEQRAAEAREVADFMASIFEAKDPNVARGEDVTAGTLLLQGAERIRSSFEDRPLVRARLMLTIGVTHRRLAMYDEAEGLLSEALAIREAELAPDHLDVAEVLGPLGITYAQTNRYEQAETAFQRAADIKVAQLAAADPDLAASLNHLAILFGFQGRYDEAAAMHKRTLEIRRAAFGPDDPSVAQSLDNLAQILHNQGLYEEAIALSREALEIRERTLHPDHLSLAENLNNLASLITDLNRPEEAEPLILRALAIQEKVLEPDHPRLAAIYNQLGHAYRRMQRFDEAEEAYRRALEIRQKAFGPIHKRVAVMHLSLGRMYREKGDLDEAEKQCLRALEIYEQVLSPGHPSTAYTWVNLGHVQHGQGRLEESALSFRRAIELRETGLGTDSPTLVEPLGNLAAVLVDQGHPEDAVDALRARPADRRGLRDARRPEHRRTHAGLPAVAARPRSRCRGRAGQAEGCPR